MKLADGEICVVVGTITDDIRLLNVPKLKVMNLNFSGVMYINPILLCK